MKVKMLTNFKTVKYGFLNNNKIYDLDIVDAKGLIKNKRAQQLDLEVQIERVKKEDAQLELKVVCPKDELKLKGLKDSKKKLKTQMVRKKSLIKANSKNKSEQEYRIQADLKPHQDKIDSLSKEIDELESKRDKSETKEN